MKVCKNLQATYCALNFCSSNYVNLWFCLSLKHVVNAVGTPQMSTVMKVKMSSSNIVGTNMLVSPPYADLSCFFLQFLQQCTLVALFQIGNQLLLWQVAQNYKNDASKDCTKNQATPCCFHQQSKYILLKAWAAMAQLVRAVVLNLFTFSYPLQYLKKFPVPLDLPSE